MNSIAFRQVHNITEKLKKIERFSEQQPDILQRREYLTIEHEWQELQQHWASLSPIGCFEIHSKLLARLNRLSWVAIIRSDHNILANSAGDRSRLCNYLFNHHVTLIEAAAMLRGMASYISSKEKADEHDRKQVGELTRQLFECWNQQQSALNNLPINYQQQLTEQADKNDMSQHLLQLIDVINPIQNPNETLPNSAEIFLGAADFLSQLEKQYNILASQLAGSMSSELASWVNGENVLTAHL